MKSQFLTKLFLQFEQSHIEYYVFGPYENLPQDTGGSDIDIVVEEKYMSMVDLILRKLCKSENVILASYYHNTMTKFYRFLTKTWGVQIDIFYKGFTYYGIEYYPKSCISPHIINHNGIRVLNQEKGYYINFFKEVVHNGEVKEKYINGFLHYFKANMSECSTEITDFYGDKIYLQILDNLTPEGLMSISKKLQKEIHKVIFRGHTTERIKELFSRICRFFHPKPGYVIVVEGTDGSGKSTIIKAITPILNEAFHNHVYYYHLRPKMLPDLGVVLGKKKVSDTNTVNTAPHSQKQSGLFGSFWRWSYYMLDYTFGYLKIVSIQIHTKSKIFIFDRYYYDYYIDQKRSRMNLPDWIIRIGDLFVHKPDILLCLGGDPYKIYARKPETSLEEVILQTKKLKKLCKQHPESIWVDTTTTTIEESIDTTMTSICLKMSKRFNKYQKQ